jgi:hypothetical protein
MNKIAARNDTSAKGPSRLARLTVYALIFFIVTGTAGFFIYVYWQSNHLKEHFENGLTHYRRGLKLLKESSEFFHNLEKENQAEAFKKYLQQTDNLVKKVDIATKEFKLAKKEFVRMQRYAIPKWSKKASSLLVKSTDESIGMSNDVAKLLSKEKKLVLVMQWLSASSDYFSQAVNAANKAVDLSNQDKFSEAKTQAETARQLFTKSRDFVEKIDKIMPSSGTNSYLNKISTALKWSENLVKMADLGASNQTSEYNRLTEENNKLGQDIVELSVAKIISDPGSWIESQTSQLSSRITKKAKRADKLRKKAIDLWKKNA